MHTLFELIIVLVPMILSLSVHEFAHAWSAYKLGDDTAKRMGRLTLNPAAHIDPIGTLLLPALLTITGSGFFFGWAKPVPVNRYRFRRGISMRTGDILTAVAGPASNVLLALLTAGVLVVGTARFGLAASSPLFVAAQHLFFINLALAVFNLLPVPPLDGHYLLPQPIQDALRRRQLLVFIVLMVAINAFAGLMAVPITVLARLIVSLWSFLIGGF